MSIPRLPPPYGIELAALRDTAQAHMYVVGEERGTETSAW